MNKGCGKKQPVLCNRWFEKEGPQIMQPISFLNDTNELVPKGIQKVLEERGL